MEISKISFENIPHKISTFSTNPFKKISKQVNNNLSPLKNDIVQITTETEKFIKKFAGDCPNTSAIKINGQDFTKYNGSQMGSNPAFWAKNDKSGELFYVKLANTPHDVAHLQEEVTACKLYKLAGIDAPEVEMCSLGLGKKAMMSKFAPKLENVSDKSDVQNAFVTDAWLANWDSLLSGNTKIKDGKVFKVDNGGSLRFRAQGAPKPNFGDKVDELKTLVDGRNWESTSVYNGISHDDLIKSFKQVCDIKDSDIKKIVKDNELAQTLINRKEYLKNVLDKVESTPNEERNLIEYFNKLKI